MRWLRLLYWVVTAVWSIWFIFSSWVLLSEFGSLLPPGPVEAHDELDLLVWAALIAWTYATPAILLFVGLRRATPATCRLARR